MTGMQTKEARTGIPGTSTGRISPFAGIDRLLITKSPAWVVAKGPRHTACRSAHRRRPVNMKLENPRRIPTSFGASWTCPVSWFRAIAQRRLQPSKSGFPSTRLSGTGADTVLYCPIAFLSVPLYRGLRRILAPGAMMPRQTQKLAEPPSTDALCPESHQILPAAAPSRAFQIPSSSHSIGLSCPQRHVYGAMPSVPPTSSCLSKDSCFT
ncbi:hypothetical protein BJY00DRAFT_220624 [Aspergillus carlsbadensis]|nr:hypothetical protein BJY00DRAFT_220624 [Aspergillus carlsbadensis]